MQKTLATIKLTKRSIRMLNIDPNKSQSIRSQNLKSLKSRLTPMQLKKVEFIADKIFELDSLELAFVNKKLGQTMEPFSKIGQISFDRYKAARVRGGILTREE